MGRRCQWRDALQVSQSMHKQSVASNAITFNALISACGKGKQPERALKVFEAVVQQSVVPTTTTYNALISACEKGTQPEQAARASPEGLQGNDAARCDAHCNYLQCLDQSL